MNIKKKDLLIDSMINFFVEYYLFKVFSLFFFVSYFDIVYDLYLVIDIAKKKKQTQMIIS